MTVATPKVATPLIPPDGESAYSTAIPDPPSDTDSVAPTGTSDPLADPGPDAPAETSDPPADPRPDAPTEASDPLADAGPVAPAEISDPPADPGPDATAETSDPPADTEPDAPAETSDATASPPEPLHTPCNPHDKVWLPVYHDQNSPMARHEWCLKTGAVRNLGGEEARPMGFFITVLGQLQTTLESEYNRTGLIAKLPHSQMRLMLKELEAIEGFSDRWWRTESSQVHEFVKAVRRHRSDIPARVIIDTVTRLW